MEAGIRYVIVSHASFGRYLKSVRHFEGQALIWTAWLDEMDALAVERVRFDAGHGIAAGLVGTTLDVYHSPTIEVYVLPQTEAPGTNLDDSALKTGPFVLEFP